MTDPCNRCAELSRAADELVTEIAEYSSAQLDIFRQGDDEKLSELDKALELTATCLFTMWNQLLTRPAV